MSAKSKGLFRAQVNRKSGRFYIVYRSCTQLPSSKQGMVWNGMEDDFSIFHTGNFLPFHFHSIPKIFHSISHSIPKFSSIFHSILKFSSIFHSILPYQRNFRLESMQRIFCCFNTKMQRPVSGMHIAHGLMHRRSLNFELGGGLNRKSCNDVVRSFWQEGLFTGQRMKDQKLGVWFGS